LPVRRIFYTEHGLRPCLASPEEIAEWADATGGAHKAAVHVDTGINRLGLSRAQAEALAADAALMERAGTVPADEPSAIRR
jgi:alanine racemase